LICGGANLFFAGAICENECHFHNMHHPFAHSKSALKSLFFLVECVNTGRAKGTRWFA
jgi:hypothetical protein